MKTIDTLGDEHMLVAGHGDGAVAIAVTHPSFGRIATVRLDHEQVAELLNALRQVALWDGRGSGPE